MSPEGHALREGVKQQARIGAMSPAVLLNLRDHVRQSLREAIIAGRLPSGERLNERALAQEMGISTTPLKEALRSLEAEGLVRTEPRRGIYVTFNARQAEEMTLARAVLEGVIARQAARHAKTGTLAILESVLEPMRAALAARDIGRLIELNERFHDAIHDASGCDYLRRLQGGQRMYDHATRLIVLAEPGERERSVREHHAIFEAIRQHDEALAEATMRQHVMLAGETHIRAAFRGRRHAAPPEAAPDPA